MHTVGRRFASARCMSGEDMFDVGFDPFDQMLPPELGGKTVVTAG